MGGGCGPRTRNLSEEASSQFHKDALCGVRRAEIPLAVCSSEVALGPRIAETTSGVVQEAVWRGQAVVVKLPAIRSSQDLERFRRELRAMAALRHPNVIRPLGARALPPNYFLLLPREGDSLHIKLHEAGWRPDWKELLEVGNCTASTQGRIGLDDAAELHRSEIDA